MTPVKNEGGDVLGSDSPSWGYGCDYFALSERTAVVSPECPQSLESLLPGQQDFLEVEGGVK